MIEWCLFLWVRDPHFVTCALKIRHHLNEKPDYLWLEGWWANTRWKIHCWLLFRECSCRAGFELATCFAWVVDLNASNKWQMGNEIFGFCFFLLLMSSTVCCLIVVALTVLPGLLLLYSCGNRWTNLASLWPASHSTTFSDPSEQVLKTHCAYNKQTHLIYYYMWVHS